MASGNLLADFRHNAAAEAQSRLQTSRIYGMTDDRGVKEMLRFNLARDTYHQQQWLAGIEQLRDDGLAATGFEDSRPDEENPEHDHTFWDLSEGSESSQGRWARGPRLDGRGRDGDAQFRHLSGAETAPIGGDTNEHLVPPDPNLFVTYDGAFGPPKPGNVGGALAQGAENLASKVKDALT